MNSSPSHITSIFYVDDDRDDLDFFQEAVERLGERVALFHLADDLIEAMHNPPPQPSIVFLDLNMPNKNGFDLLQEIKASDAFQNLPLVVYSTASDTHTVQRCRKLGASLYIRKPTSIAALQQALRNVLAINWETFEPCEKNFVV